eukprot:10263737-Lingulodinium_polyedra.AAC.1
MQIASGLGAERKDCAERVRKRAETMQPVAEPERRTARKKNATVELYAPHSLHACSFCRAFPGNSGASPA